MAEKKSFLKGKKPITFIDLFAGAGGISEGFLQAYTSDKYFKFILASDINENCELTHIVRYNHQFGLDTKFLTADIMAPEFMPRLLAQLGNVEIDVVTGGPSCQSFSLSGRRRRFDKRDNLFLNYLAVIRKLRPKYFVMENVKGLLTKDKGKFKEAIIREIRSIIDDRNIPSFLHFVAGLLDRNVSSFIKNCFLSKIKMEVTDDEDARAERENYFSFLESQFKSITRKIDYRLSKSNTNIATIRHGLNLLRRTDERNAISAAIINEKTQADVDNDFFVNQFNSFISFIDDSTITNTILSAIDTFDKFDKSSDDVGNFREMIRLYSYSLDETLSLLRNYTKDKKETAELDKYLEDIRLYRVAKPIVAVAADYGVPQNRERVLFIGCRKDQKLIDAVPPTVSEEEKVTVYEAIHDLDFLGNGSIADTYGRQRIIPEYESLIRRREVQGHISEANDTHTFSEWSKIGRFGHRFDFRCEPFYVRSLEDLHNNLSFTKLRFYITIRQVLKAMMLKKGFPSLPNTAFTMKIVKMNFHNWG